MAGLGWGESPAPVAEPRHAWEARQRARRMRPREPLFRNHLQDHRRAGARLLALGAALGVTLSKRSSRVAENAATRRRYTGINVLVLWSEGIRRGFPANRWLTFRQALALGGHIRRGERGVAIVYADRFIPKGKNRRRDGPDEEGAAIPFLKRFTVFNVAQCDSLPEDVAVSALSGSSLPIEPQVEALIRASRIDFRVGGDRAFYAPAHDFVQVPPHDAFYEPINWYRTALHELGHATGHPSRLNRDLSGVFGSKKYAFEELVAEVGAAFCCSALGMAPTVRHADYIAPGSSCFERTTAPSFAPLPEPAKLRTGSSGVLDRLVSRAPSR